MNPNAEQIKQALANHRRPPRTPGARLRDAISHTKKSRVHHPASKNVFSQTIGAANTGKQGSHHVSDRNYTPPE